MAQFKERPDQNVVHINPTTVKAVRDNPDEPGKVANVEMLDGKYIYIEGNHADVAKKLGC